MAMADYYLCDRCGGKAIYDDNWHDQAEASGADICIICERCKGLGYRAEIVYRPPEGTAQANFDRVTS